MGSSDEVLVIGDKAYSLKEGVPPAVRDYVSKKLAQKRYQKLPPLSDIFNIVDFEPIAEDYIEKDAWVYFRTGAADEITLYENTAAYRRIYFKPRILNDVSTVDTSTTIFGTKVDSPFYVTAFYGSHFPSSNSERGEKPLVTAAGHRNIMQMIPQYSIFTLEEVLKESKPGQKHWLQIYVNSDKSETEDLIRRAEASGKVEALFFTVDTAQLGRRETELRAKGDSSFVNSNVDGMGHSAKLDWEMIANFRKITNLKIVLKGIQTVEDSVKAAELGFDGILISNHGGRQLDTARSTIEVLAEVVPILKSKNLYHRLEIFVDGGIRRGSDIAKALCLGAKAVGLGRPMLYPLVTYGEPGVLRAIDILQQDLELNMRLLGSRSLAELHEGLVDTNDLFNNRYIKL